MCADCYFMISFGPDRIRSCGVNRSYGVTEAAVCVAAPGSRVIDGAFQAETTIVYFSGVCGGSLAVTVMDSSGISSM